MNTQPVRSLGTGILMIKTSLSLSAAELPAKPHQQVSSEEFKSLKHSFGQKKRVQGKHC